MSTDIFDSDTPADIPTSAPGAALYTDGPNAARDSDFERFDGKPCIKITRTITDADADALDVETGAASPAQARTWVKARNDKGDRIAIVYANLSTWPALDKTLAGLKYQRWVAHWTGKSHTEPGAAIVQWANSAMTGHHYDQSTIFDAALEKIMVRASPATGNPAALLKAAAASLAAAQQDVASAISALGG